LTPLGQERFFYVTTARADATGRYELVLPYSNESFSPVVEVGQHYQLGTGRLKVKLKVSEKDVRRGRDVVGPDFR
jgi:hypothetical protein